MDRRRGLASRTSSSEEFERWHRASEYIQTVSTLHEDNGSTIGRVNRAIASWPTDDTLPADGYDGLKSIARKLESGLNELKRNSDKEAEVIEKALKCITELIALRKSSESALQEKRNKRPRAQSPAHSHAASPAPSVTSSRGSVSITLPPRSGTPATAARDAKAKRDALNRQYPLRPGRKVAFHPPPKGGANESEWIMAVITKHLGDNKYEVHDPEPQEDGQPASQIYMTTTRSFRPLPDVEVSSSDPSHYSHYPEQPLGARVIALYPDTSCFYRAEVTGGLTQLQGPIPVYKLRFDDDGDQEHLISVQYVVTEAPSGPS